MLNCNDSEIAKFTFLPFGNISVNIKKYIYYYYLIYSQAQNCNKTSHPQTFQLMKNIPTYSVDSHEGRALNLLCFI